MRINDFEKVLVKRVSVDGLDSKLFTWVDLASFVADIASKKDKDENFVSLSFVDANNEHFDLRTCDFDNINNDSDIIDFVCNKSGFSSLVDEFLQNEDVEFDSDFDNDDVIVDEDSANSIISDLQHAKRLGKLDILKDL